VKRAIEEKIMGILHSSGEYDNAVKRGVEEDQRRETLAYPHTEATKLTQYFGKRVEYRGKRDGSIEITVLDSKMRQLGRKTVTRPMFDARPTDTNPNEVSWACAAVGVEM
jgi:hypothetical protein